MAFEWSKLLDWAKLKPRTWFAMATASTALLLLPEDILSGTGLDEIVVGYRSWLGVALLLSLALLFAHVAGETWNWGREWLKANRHLRALHGQLRELSPGEKHVLKKYIEGQTTTLYFTVSDGVIGGLVAKKILFQSSSIGQMHSFSYNLQPWAWTYLRAHPDILVGASAE